MSNPHTDRARWFIDDVLKINAEHGMGNIEDGYRAAVAQAARWAERLSRLT